jgi:hypothetical protein
LGLGLRLAKYPKVSFFVTSVRLPEITLGTAIQPSHTLKDLDVPGDKLVYGDFNSDDSMLMKIMENYMIVHNWLTGSGLSQKRH